MTNWHRRLGEWLRRKPRWRRLLGILALAVIYHLVARLGLRMAYVQINTSPVWPPTGIALAALFLGGLELWPGVALGVLIGSMLTGAPALLALGLATGNTLEALVGVVLLKRLFHFDPSLERLHDVFGLVVAALVAAAVSATVGVSTLLALNLEPWTAFWGLWITWYVGNLLGALVVAPVLLVWATPARRPLPRAAALEAAAVLLLLGSATWYVFSNQPPETFAHQALTYVIFPFVVWLCLRHGPRFSTLGIVLVSGIAIYGTTRGTGPFVVGSITESLILLQTFMAVLTLISLTLSAAVVERRRAIEALRQQVEDLAALNDSAQAFLGSLNLNTIYTEICRLVVSRLGVSAAWVETGPPETESWATVAVQGASSEDVAAAISAWPERAAILEGGEVRLATAADALPRMPPAGFRAYAALPLDLAGKRVCILNLLSRRESFFTADRLLLLRSFATLAAVAIENTRLVEEVRASNRQLQGLSHRLLRAQEEERLHLSRELHDESGQLLAALMVHLGLLERDAARPEAVTERIRELKTTALQVQDNLHRLAMNLRPASLDHLGLVMALEQYVADFRRQHGLDVQFEAVGMERERLGSEVEAALFRVIQESLTNVVLHARATRVDVVLHRRDRQLVAIIEDNGVGLPGAGQVGDGRLGLFGMQERIEMLGGTFALESAPGKGTTIRVAIPSHD